MGNEDNLWDFSIKEIIDGFTFDAKKDMFQCLICGRGYEQGVIYTIHDVMCDAKFAIQKHIEHEHESMLDYLLNMNKKHTGLSEVQKDLITLFKKGFKDQDIAKTLGIGSKSTIRTHRFKLKEKERQAKIFLAIMELLRAEQGEEDAFVKIHKGATMVDERYGITTKEKEKVLTTYFQKGMDGPLSQFPSKEKRKIIILQHLITKFERQKIYTEKEINDVLKKVFDDYVTLRRYLIEYGFMDRSKDGSQYWVKE